MLNNRRLTDKEIAVEREMKTEMYQKYARLCVFLGLNTKYMYKYTRTR